MTYLPVVGLITSTVIAMAEPPASSPATQPQTYGLTSRDLPPIEMGASVAEFREFCQANKKLIESRFPEPKPTADGPAHLPLTQWQFKTTVDGRSIDCLSAGLWSRANIWGYSLNFYFVFEDDHLAKIIEAPRHETRRAIEDGLPVAKVVVDPHARMQRVFETSSLSLTILMSAAADVANVCFMPKPPDPEEEAFMRQVGPKGIEALQEMVTRSRLMREALERRCHMIRSQFDPSKVKIGTTTKDLPEPFNGAPTKVISDPRAIEIRIFGEDVDLTEYGSILQRYQLPWVAIEVIEDRVAGVYADDFLDPAWFDE